MIDFIDKTSEQNGTPIDRNHMMGIQGFVTATIRKNADGSITRENAFGDTLTSTFDNLTNIREVFQGEKTITRTIRFTANGWEVSLS